MRLAFSPILVAVMAACSSGEGGSAAGRVKTPFTIWVLETSVPAGGSSAPLANVPVAFDLPGHERVKKSTEADGHVTFEGDFQAGPASVTVLSKDHVYTTMLGTSPDAARARPNEAGKPPSDLVVFPLPLDRTSAAKTVELSGRIFGKRDPYDVVSVAVSFLARFGSVRALESTYALRVPKDRPAFLIGHETRTLVDDAGDVVENELLKSFRIELPARAVDASLDLDLAKLPSLPTRLIHVRVEAGSFAAGTRATASTRSAVSSLETGLFARYRPAADAGAFDVDVTLADADVGDEPLVSHGVLTGPDGAQSVRTEAGIQSDGTVWRDFVAPPTIRDPESSRSVREPIVLDQFPSGADLVAKLYAGGGQLFWVVYGPSGGLTGNTFTIPYDDEITSADIQLFVLSVGARRERIPLAAGADEYRYAATSRDIILRKQ